MKFNTSKWKSLRQRNINNITYTILALSSTEHCKYLHESYYSLTLNGLSTLKTLLPKPGLIKWNINIKVPSAFKSLDSYHVVVSNRWMGSLYVKKWPHAVLVKCNVKPSQWSGVIYKIWVAIKPCGSVQCGYCTCMAGLSEVCKTIIGAVLYKAMHEISTLAEISCTSLSNKWLPATVKKTVSPSQLSEIDFQLFKIDKCQSAISQPKRVKL